MPELLKVFELATNQDPAYRTDLKQDSNIWKNLVLKCIDKAINVQVRMVQSPTLLVFGIESFCRLARRTLNPFLVSQST